MGGFGDEGGLWNFGDVFGDLQSYSVVLTLQQIDCTSNYYYLLVFMVQSLT